MEYRSRSGRMEMEAYNRGHPAPGMHDMRSYSASYTSQPHPREMKVKKMKNNGGASSSKGWSLDDPELQRKKRVTTYKVYIVEGKVKGSLRKSFRWLKDRYTQTMYGWW